MNRNRNQTPIQPHRSRRANAIICQALESRVLLTVPHWSNFIFDPATDHSVKIDFDLDVRPESQTIRDGLQKTDLIVQTVGPVDTFIDPSLILLSNPAPGMHGKLTFADQPLVFNRTDLLPEGNYRASISSQDVADGTINDPEEMEEVGVPGPKSAVRDFHVLKADGNMDRFVNLADFNIIAGHFGLSPATFGEGDFNYDGSVGLPDFNLLAGQFGASMPAPPTGPNEIRVEVNTDFTFDLEWLDTVVPPAQEQGWRVQYSLSGDFQDAVILQPDLPPDSTGTTTPAFPHGTRVWWRSRAFGNGQDTAYTAKRYGITPLPEPTVTDVSALSSSQIKIVFTDNSQNETEFHVFRSTSLGGTYSHVGNRNYLRQTFAEPSNPLGFWPNGTDHTTRVDRRGRIRGRGIAEDPNVQALVISYLWQAYYDTYFLYP